MGIFGLVKDVILLPVDVALDATLITPASRIVSESSKDTPFGTIDRLAPRHKSKIISKTIINDLIRFRRENEPTLEDVKKFFGVVEAFIEKSGSINEVAAVSKAAKGLKQQAELRLVYFGDGGNIQTGKQYRLLMPKSCRVS